MFHITWGAGLCTRFTTSICPKARPVGVATIEAITTLGPLSPMVQAGMKLRAGVWHLSSDCIDAMDDYLGVLGVLKKAYTRVTIEDVTFPAQIYLADSARSAMGILSSHLYLHRRGYDEWGFPQGDMEAVLDLLDHAVAA